jgi:hypothetical protein
MSLLLAAMPHGAGAQVPPAVADFIFGKMLKGLKTTYTAIKRF